MCFGKYKIKLGLKEIERQRYRCKDCTKTFTGVTLAPLYYTHKPNKWIDFIKWMLAGYSLRKSAELIGDIHYVTLFYWRHKVLFALKQMDFESFSGIVEMDETYFLYSEKDKRNIEGRKRGGSSQFRGISHEQVCVLIARDRQKSTYSGVLGRGRDKQIQYFTHYHCIVPELPEHGLNNYENKFSIKDSAKELIKLIEEKARGKKVILIGFSLGSQIIIQMLGLKPNLIDFAIINSALVRPNPYVKKLLQPTIRLSFPLIKHRWFSKLQAKILYIGEDYFERYYKDSRQIKLDTLVRVLGENMSLEISKDFRKANGKILVTVGEKEKAVMKKSAKDIVKTNSNCTGVIIPEIGHGISLAMPDFFNYMVETWIQKGDFPKKCKVII